MAVKGCAFYSDEYVARLYEAGVGAEVRRAWTADDFQQPFECCIIFFFRF
jgi:hypothetical protein